MIRAVWRWRIAWLCAACWSVLAGAGEPKPRDVMPGEAVNVAVVVPASTLAPDDDRSTLQERLTAPASVTLLSTGRPWTDGTTLRIITLLLDPRTPAGDHEVIYHLDGARRPYTKRFLLRVAAVHEWEVTSTQHAGVMIGGVDQAFCYTLINRGNVVETVNLEAQISPRWPTRIEPGGQVTLQPGERREVTVIAHVPLLTQSEEVTLWLRADTSETERQQARHDGEALPNADRGGGRARVLVDSTLRVSAGMGEESDGSQGAGYQVAVDGDQRWDDLEWQLMRYSLRVPTLDTAGWRASDSTAYLELQHREFALKLGEQNYAWDRLVLPSVFGLGGQFAIKQPGGRSEVTAVFDEIEGGREQTVFGLRQTWDAAPGQEWGLGLAYHRRAISDATEVQRSFLAGSLHQDFGTTGKLDLNLALSIGDGGMAYGGQIAASQSFIDGRLRLSLQGRYTTEAFNVSHDDSRLLSLYSSYRLTTGWSLFANANYNSRLRTLERTLDPNPDEVADEDLQRSEALTANIGYRGRFGRAIDLTQTLRFRRNSPESADPTSTEDLGLRTAVGARLSRRLRIRGDLEFGQTSRTEEPTTGYRRSGVTLDYRLLPGWDVDMGIHYDREDERTSMRYDAGVSGSLGQATDLRLATSYYVDDDEGRIDLTANAEHRFRNGHRLNVEFASRDAGGERQEYTATLHYVIPFGMPTVRDPRVGYLHGRLSRRSDGAEQPVADAIVRLGDQAALADEDGEYVFTHAAVGDHVVTVSTADDHGRPLIPLHGTQTVSITGGERLQHDIAMTARRSIRVHVIPPTLTPMQRALMATSGPARLDGIAVIFRGADGTAVRRETDRDGICIHDTANNQAWTISVHTATLPAGYRAAEPQQTLILDERQTDYDLTIALTVASETLEWIKPEVSTPP